MPGMVALQQPLASPKPPLGRETALLPNNRMVKMTNPGDESTVTMNDGSRVINCTDKVYVDGNPMTTRTYPDANLTMSRPTSSSNIATTIKLTIKNCAYVGFGACDPVLGRFVGRDGVGSGFGMLLGVLVFALIVFVVGLRGRGVE